MKIKCENGVYQVRNGLWGYRFSIVVDGRRVSRKKTTDQDGNQLKTQRQALKAREQAIQQLQTDAKRQRKISRRTFEEVYKEYCDNGRNGKAYTTMKKQDSLWKNHLGSRFGKRFVDDISVAEVNDYLSELYFVDGYSFRYVEGFLKMFYLIFGQAYSRDYLEVDAYNKLCVNKNSRIKMPTLKTEDDTDIVVFSKEEIKVMDEYFKGKSTETAYLLGKFCGLRINECFGLKWKNVDIENGTIFIDRQMQYQNGLIKLVSPKTRNSKRTVYMNDFLKEHFVELRKQVDEYEEKKKSVRKQNRKMIEDVDGSMIYSTDLVNCFPDGKIQSVNSMKYPSRAIKQMGIEFKFHYLRHTYGTRMAEMNTPTHLLCNQMGHGNIHVTEAYYIGISKTGVEILKDNLNSL